MINTEFTWTGNVNISVGKL